MSKDTLLGRIWNWSFGHDRSIGFGLENIGKATLRWPRIVATFVLAMTIFTVTQIPRASVDGDMLRVFAHSGEEYTAYQHLADTFGTFENDIYLLVNSPDLTNPETIETIRAMALDLSNSEYITGTMSAFTLRVPGPDGTTLPAVPEGLQSPEEVSKALTDLYNNDPMMKNLINPDLSGVVIIVFPNPEMTKGGGTRAMINDLRSLVDDYKSDSVQVELTGPPIWTSEMLNAAVDDQITFTVYGFALGALIALLSLRSFWGAILVAATPFVAVVWVMGTIIALFGSFSFLTIIVTTIVLVIAFAESLFFIFNWLAYWREGMDPYKAVDETVRVVGPASGLTMLTTLVSFLSLSLTAGQGIQEFSWAGSIASVTNFICLMTFLPLLLKLAVRLGFKAPKPSYAITAPIPVAWFVASRLGRPLAAVAIVLTGLLLIPYALIQPRFSFEDFMAKDSTALTAAEEIDAGVGGVAPLYVNVPLDEGIADVGDQDFEKVKQVHQIVEKYLGQNKVISAAAFTHYADSGFTREQIFNAVGDLKRRFVTDDGNRALVTGFMPTIISSEELIRLKEGIEADIKAAGIAGAEVGGFRVMTTYATDSIVRGLQLDLTLSVIVNLFLIGWAFRSLRVAVAAAIPNLFPVLGTEAWLYFSGSGLQLTTVLALTIAFGIAVDDTTHFLSHYLHSRREEGRSHMDAIHHTMQRIGGAIIAATLILCSGMAIVMFSALPQVALFGTLFVITLGFALIGDVFILPALLVAGGRFFHPLGGVKK
ncbi:MMPL family transporter [Devosia sp. ZB163]|uniref:efflux RND transporter permease subunit n=1 Tax=Devosia sp. ZB163 TaxID=3025938 RepID=UPI00236077E7|nr:MMPL family transporter [Devosia sp. ZB163]MDC9824406.1 MMPL family transporter [Devosia sp. ZB163]